MNVQLHHAISDITGIIGLSIVNGDRDFSMLIQYLALVNQEAQKSLSCEIFCHAFEIHRRSCKFLKNLPDQLDIRKTALHSQVQESHKISYGSAGAGSISILATLKGFRMECGFAGKLMKKVVTCKLSVYRYKRGRQEQIATPNVTKNGKKSQPA